jgi:hypothetical protein
VKEDEIDKAYSTNGGEGYCIEDIGGIASKKETIGKAKT